MSQYQHVAAKNRANNALCKQTIEQQLSICASGFMPKKIVNFKRSFLNAWNRGCGIFILKRVFCFCDERKCFARIAQPRVVPETDRY
jgi:hypothetical protein